MPVAGGMEPRAGLPNDGREVHAEHLKRAPCRVADYFAQLNNKMGGDLKKIQVVGEYMVEIWKAVGMDMSRVQVTTVLRAPREARAAHRRKPGQLSHRCCLAEPRPSSTWSHVQLPTDQAVQRGPQKAHFIPCPSQLPPCSSVFAIKPSQPQESPLKHSRPARLVILLTAAFRGHLGFVLTVVLCVSQFISASKEINERAAEYWPLVMDIARRNNVKRIMRCGQIMGRSDTDEMSAAQIFYPCMQCADIFFLKARHTTPTLTMTPTLTLTLTPSYGTSL